MDDKTNIHFKMDEDGYLEYITINYPATKENEAVTAEISLEGLDAFAIYFETIEPGKTFEDIVELVTFLASLPFNELKHHTEMIDAEC